MPAGGQHPCLAEVTASQVLWAEGHDRARASRSRTQRFREELFGTRKVKPPGREQYLGSQMRLSLENSRELPLRSFSLLQIEGNGYSIKVLNLTLNQQLAGAVTSPGSATHLIQCCPPHKGRQWGQHLKIHPLLPQGLKGPGQARLETPPGRGQCTPNAPAGQTPLALLLWSLMQESTDVGAQNQPLGGYCKARQTPQKFHAPPGTEVG